MNKIHRKRTSRALWALMLIGGFLLSGGIAAALKVPALEGRVNDYASMLSADTVDHLERMLEDLEEEESTQIVVLTIPSLGGESIEGFSLKVAETWQIGQKGLDNGALLVISSKDRKLRIEVGYGLEGRLTDLVCGRIIRQVIVPRFKEGQFDRGVVLGVDAMIKAVRGEFKDAAFVEEPSESRGGAVSVKLIAFLIIGIFSLFRIFPNLLFFLLGSRKKRGRGFWGGYTGGWYSSSGGFGGGFGGGFSGGGGGFGGGGASGGW